MAGHHPHGEHRAHLHEKHRVSHITRGYATGGAVHGDEAEDEKLIRKEVKASALKKRGGKIEGKSAHARLDRGGIKRARGGKVKGKGTTVNVIVAGKDGAAGGPPPGIGAAAPPMPMPPPKPPMPPPGAGGPPGMPPGMPPPGGPPMMRAKGGRIPKGGELEHQNKTASALPRRARGGRIGVEGEELGTAARTGVADSSREKGRPKNGPAWAEGLRNGTQISHTPGSTDAASIEAHMGVKKVRTYATGGKVKGVSVDEKPAIKVGEMGLSASKSNPFPKMKHAGGGGLGRIEKMHKAVKGVSAP